jgi:cytochrome d ubiquinol oxidase subunit II
MIDYAVLRLIWWGLMGILLAGFAIMDGFDLGVAALIPLVGRTDLERRIAINTVGPVWEGNQVWIILGGGVFFAAWPYLYATSFSGFYLAILLLLATFIMRPVGFKYRSKLQKQGWRTFWDYTLAISGFLSSVVFGVAVGNVLQGVPFHFDEMLRVYYTGSFWALFNPFALLCGVLSAVMLMMHGAFYLVVKTTDAVQARALTIARTLAVLLIVLFAAGGYWVAHGIQGYVLTHFPGMDAPSNPLHNTVVLQSGAWMANYVKYPFVIAAPVLGFVGAFFAALLARKCSKLAFVSSACSLAGVILTVGVSMFPFIMPSSSHPNMSLTVWDASSSQLSLFLMLLVTIVFLPIVLAYTAWVYRVLRGKVTADTVNNNDQAY